MSMRSACCLLGIEASQLRMWLCHRKIETVGETLVKPLTQVQVCVCVSTRTLAVGYFWSAWCDIGVWLLCDDIWYFHVDMLLVHDDM